MGGLTQVEDGKNNNYLNFSTENPFTYKENQVENNYKIKKRKINSYVSKPPIPTSKLEQNKS